MVTAFQTLFNNMVKRRYTPQQLKDAVITLVYKKGCRTDPNNFRPINLLSHICKVFITIIYERLKDNFVNFLPTDQAAYQENRGCIEQILSLLQLAEKAIEYNKPLYVVFVDFVAAFDSIEGSAIWNSLKEAGINKSYIDGLKSVYTNSPARVRTERGMTEVFNIRRVLKIFRDAFGAENV